MQRVTERRLTYDDLPRMAELILAKDEVAELYRNHFAAVVVDEFQDLTPQQLRIIRRIGDGRTTFAGDLAQGIYGFTGAKPDEVFTQIKKQVTEVVELAESHRSSPAVLSAVNALTPKTLGTPLTSAAPATWPAGGIAASVSMKTVNEEATWIVRFAQQLLSRAPEQRIGVISRSGPRRRFVDAGFADITDVEVHRWDDGVLDTETARKVKTLLAAVDGDAALAAQDSLEYLRNFARFEDVQDPGDRLALAGALSWILDLLTQGLTPAQVTKRVRVGDNSTLLTKPGVHLLTGHAGKGQQFDWVVVIGMEDGNIPFFEAKTDDALREEARVLAVMMSRARHGLVLTRADAVPAQNGQIYSKSASRFLSPEVNAHLSDASEFVRWLNAADWAAIAAR